MDGAFTTTIDIRFRDIDELGHVNNAVYATYTEQARIDYFEHVYDAAIEDLPTVLAAHSISFRQPVTLRHDQVEVTLAVTTLGRTSVEIDYEIHIDEGIAAEASSTQVVIDPETGDPTPIPDRFREAIAARHEL